MASISPFYFYKALHYNIPIIKNKFERFATLKPKAFKLCSHFCNTADGPKRQRYDKLRMKST
ncbi:MAG TPA: hypothetical protein DCZ48_05735 [Methylococcaceae bacterium]|nr:hypothetical protein [Methylococcaceae bacterium]